MVRRAEYEGIGESGGEGRERLEKRKEKERGERGREAGMSDIHPWYHQASHFLFGEGPCYLAYNKE